MTLSDSSKWALLNERGFIPGPKEQEKEFFARVELCERLVDELFSLSEDEFFLHSSTPIFLMNEENILSESKKNYGISPGWVPIFFSNKDLKIWHGGCVWIFQIRENGPICALLQLKREFQKKASHLRIYKKKEILLHEVAHIGRMAYDEPEFEEILAYSSSDSSFRRYCGPIFRSEKETFVLMSLLSLSMLISFASLFWSSLSLLVILFFFSLPCVFIFYLICHLIQRQRQFKRCLVNLIKVYQDRDLARSLLYRLTDKEIHEFAGSSSEKIIEYILTERDKTFRWKFLFFLYPLNMSDDWG